MQINDNVPGENYGLDLIKLKAKSEKDHVYTLGAGVYYRGL